jgi:hypothetical protein
MLKKLVFAPFRFRQMANPDGQVSDAARYTAQYGNVFCLTCRLLPFGV